MMVDYNITRENFYYEYEFSKNVKHLGIDKSEISIPRKTICLKELTVTDDDGISRHYYVKGLTICGKKNKFSKDLGRLYAEERADEIVGLFVRYKSLSAIDEHLERTAITAMRTYGWQILTIDQLSEFEREDVLGLDEFDINRLMESPVDPNLENRLDVNDEY
jgi:hypothetical protein